MMENIGTKSEAAILMLVVFVLGILLGGLGSHAWEEHMWSPPGAPRSFSHQIISDLADELQLSADQRKELSAIVDDSKAQIRAAYAPADAQREQLRQQGSARIRAILTPDQLPKFDAYRQRIDEQRKKATDPPPPPP
jgi:hypothetical protein